MQPRPHRSGIVRRPTASIVRGRQRLNHGVIGAPSHPRFFSQLSLIGANSLISNMVLHQQAAINAVHSDARLAGDTDWRQIRVLYDQLMACAPTPVVALNRSVAVAEVDGPQAALDLVDALDLGDYHVFHAVRADLLRRLGRITEAIEAYSSAMAHSENQAEREVLRRRRDSLDSSQQPAE